jgi:hypothetical protein
VRSGVSEEHPIRLSMFVCLSVAILLGTRQYTLAQLFLEHIVVGCIADLSEIPTVSLKGEVFRNIRFMCFHLDSVENTIDTCIQSNGNRRY